MITRLRSKGFGALFGAVLLLFTLATVVSAGSASINPWNNINRGWESGTFYDDNLSGADTKVTFLAACDDGDSGTSNSQEYARLQLWRFAGFFPWEDRGLIQHTCGNASNVVWNWGAQASPAEHFKWAVPGFSGSGGPTNKLSVPSPGVTYSW
ncbi:MAG: hypothetical protein ABI744_04220 [Chloroflexota bacterium]